MTQRLGLGAAVVLWGPGWRRAWSLLLCSAWTSIKVSTAFTKISVFKFPIISQMPACLCTSLMVPTLSARMGAPLASLGVLSLRNLTLQPKRAFGKNSAEKQTACSQDTQEAHATPQTHTLCTLLGVRQMHNCTFMGRLLPEESDRQVDWIHASEPKGLLRREQADSGFWSHVQASELASQLTCNFNREKLFLTKRTFDLVSQGTASFPGIIKLLCGFDITPTIPPPPPTMDDWLLFYFLWLKFARGVGWGEVL